MMREDFYEMLFGKFESEFKKHKEEKINLS